MKNPVEVLQIKELELLKVKKEVEALRVAVQLMAEETGTSQQTMGPRPQVEMS